MDLSDATSSKITALQLDEPLRAGRLECVGGVGLMLLAAGIAAANITLEVLAGWLVGCGLTYLARFMLLEKFAAQPDLGQTIFMPFIISLAATGLAFGGLAAWIVWQSGAAAAGPLLLLLVALGALSLSVYGGAVPVVWAVNLSVLGPPLLALSQLPSGASIPFMSALLGVSVVLVAGAWRRRQASWLVAAAAEETEQLRLYLDQRREQVGKLQVETKATLQKCEEAEIELRRLSADVGMAQGKSKALADMLTRVSPIDQVTGLDNRRHFESSVDAEWRRAFREGKLMSLIILELDDMDAYVEAYSRPSADALFKRLGLSLRGFGRRAGDTAARYDETRLALLLPNCDARNAERLAEALRTKVANANIPHVRAKAGQTLTTHIGVATVKPAKNRSFEELLRRTEAALYEANFQEGNTVTAYRPLSALRIERWDQATNGLLSEQAMTQKLLVWGYDTHRQVLAAGSPTESQTFEADSIIAVLTGELCLELEGHTMSIKGGDCVVLPAGTTLAMTVVGTRAVLKFTAMQLQ
ncbi:MAG: diguanylate cyclase [Gammaproteobacteria bacterium]|nr:diguanylate cyclase [Gammaproteobacteria bacterium]